MTPFRRPILEIAFNAQTHHTTAPDSITASQAAVILNRDSQCPWRSCRALSEPETKKW